jgi:hypothetical protein
MLVVVGGSAALCAANESGGAMSWMKKLCAAVLMPVSLSALAQAPFEFGGMHTDLVFSEAVVKAQQLGGTCRVKVAKSSGGGVTANCELLPCTIGTKVGVCQEQHALPTKLAIGAQPIFRIALDAQAESLPLRRITFLYDGSFEDLAQNLITRYGAPTSDGTTDAQQGWNHSRQRHWTKGTYNMALVNTPKLLILTANPAAADAGAH